MDASAIEWDDLASMKRGRVSVLFLVGAIAIASLLLYLPLEPNAGAEVTGHRMRLDDDPVEARSAE